MFSAEGVERWHSAGRDLERLRPRGDISLIYSHPTQPRLKKKKNRVKEGETQGDGKRSIVYFHRNIPGVDSYSLVWKAESQRNFPDSRRGEELPL